MDCLISGGLGGDQRVGPTVTNQISGVTTTHASPVKHLGAPVQDASDWARPYLTPEVVTGTHGVLSHFTLISWQMNFAKGAIFFATEAASNASRHCFLWVVRTMVHEYPTDAIITFMKNRAIRPFPST